MTQAALNLPRPPRGLIETPEALAEVCAHLAAAGVFALDMEFIPEYTYRAELCLVQVATEERVELIDPQKLPDLKPFWDLMADPEIEKVCHAGSSDLKVSWQQGRQKPRRVFDCQIGAALVGIGYELAHWRLVETVTGVRLPNDQTRSDWSRRPLDDKQLAYAINDVRYLPLVRRALLEELNARQRRGWMEQACAASCAEAAVDVDPTAAYLRVKEVWKLAPRQLAILQELADLRERVAAAENLPLGRVLDDKSLVELARKAPATLDELCKLRGREAGPNDAQIVAAIQRGREKPRAQWPSPPPSVEDTTATLWLADTLEAAGRALCTGQEVAWRLVTSRPEIERLARLIAQDQDLSAHPLMHGWVYECLGAPLLELLREQTEVNLRMQQGRLRAEFHRNDVGAI